MFSIWILESCLQIWLFKVEVKFTWRNVNHFEVSSSVAFSVFTGVCATTSYVVSSHFHHFKRKLHTLFQIWFDEDRFIIKMKAESLSLLPNVTLACLSFRITGESEMQTLGSYSRKFRFIEGGAQESIVVQSRGNVMLCGSLCTTF